MILDARPVASRRSQRTADAAAFGNRSHPTGAALDDVRVVRDPTDAANVRAGVHAFRCRGPTATRGVTSWRTATVGRAAPSRLWLVNRTARPIVRDVLGVGCGAPGITLVDRRARPVARALGHRLPELHVGSTAATFRCRPRIRHRARRRRGRRPRRCFRCARSCGWTSAGPVRGCGSTPTCRRHGAAPARRAQDCGR